MCRYALKSYKKHYACFRCRKSFKRRNKSEVAVTMEDHPARCPECALLMADMGLDFAPPKKSDKKAWAAAAALYEVGETFHSCGCGGPGYRPRDPAKLDAFFEMRGLEYAKHLEAWERESDSAERTAAIDVWRNRIAKLRASQTTGNPGTR